MGMTNEQKAKLLARCERCIARGGEWGVTVKAVDIKALLEELVTARAEGFARAREMAAERYDERATAEKTSSDRYRDELEGFAEMWASEARCVRAMQDDGAGAGEQDPKARMVADFRGIGATLDDWQVSGSPFISRRDNLWCFEAAFKVREIADRIASDYSEKPADATRAEGESSATEGCSDSPWDFECPGCDECSDDAPATSRETRTETACASVAAGIDIPDGRIPGFNYACGLLTCAACEPIRRKMEEPA